MIYIICKYCKLFEKKSCIQRKSIAIVTAPLKSSKPIKNTTRKTCLHELSCIISGLKYLLFVLLTFAVFFLFCSVEVR